MIQPLPIHRTEGNSSPAGEAALDTILLFEAVKQAVRAPPPNSSETPSMRPARGQPGALREELQIVDILAHQLPSDLVRRYPSLAARLVRLTVLERAPAETAPKHPVENGRRQSAVERMRKHASRQRSAKRKV